MKRARAFTLIELLTALAILSLLALLSYRALAAVSETREHVKAESAKWRDLSAFFDRFERDVYGGAQHAAYALNNSRQIELTLSNVRYVVLNDVAAFDVRYLTEDRRALTVRLAFTSGEEIVRTFLLQ